MATKTSLSLLTLALAAAPALAMQPIDRENPRVAVLAAHLEAAKGQLGLNADHAFVLRSAHQDELGMTHAAFQQTYKGVKVFGGEIISHAGKNGAIRPDTNEVKAGISLNVTPSIEKAEALAIAHREMAPKAPYVANPEAELVVFPMKTLVHVRPGTDATAYEERVTGYRLAYVVTAKVESEAQTSHMKYVVDAHTGAILQSWNDLHATDATGTASTQYSGSRQIHTNYTGSTYQMVDNFRAMHISTYNLNHATSGQGTLYTDADNTWGDGANYVEGSSTTAANGETAATDAHYGIEVTYDFYKGMFGRNGIDNANRATYSRVHYSNSYDNAFWDDTCFCMTYGDGSSFTTLTSLDVAGHEMSHGVCANSANLTYSGEPGGLNESNSDILGNMVELYSRNSNTLPATTTNTDNCWKVGEQLASTPLRYMYKPSLDGASKDAWSSTLGSLNVHYSSGPNNRMFFFLSQGASSSSTSNYYSSYTPSGFTGIGPAKAAQIWYRALTVYLTSSSNYSAARTACISAAKDLYGAGGAEEAAVWNSYAAINVGSAWSGTSTTLSAAISAPSGNITVATGTSVTFTGSASGGTSPYTYSWTFGDGGTSTAASTSHTYTNTGTSNVTYTATFKVTDSKGATASATRTVTVQPSGSTGGSELILNGGFESGATSWTQTSGVIGSYTGEPAHGGSYDAWMNGYGSAHTDYVYQQVAIPSTATGTLTFWLHIDTAETTTTTAYDTMKVQVLNTSGTVLATKATYSNLNKNTGYAQKSIDLSAYKGQTVRIRFYGVEDSSLQTSFVVDDISLK